MKKRTKYPFLASAVAVVALTFAGGASANTESEKILNYYNQYSSQAPVVQQNITVPNNTSSVNNQINLEQVKSEVSKSQTVEEMLTKILTMFNNQSPQSQDVKKEPHVEGYTPVTTKPNTTQPVQPTQLTQPVDGVTVVHGPTSGQATSAISLGQTVTLALDSNNDETRRSALQDLYGISLTENNVWSGSKQDGTTKTPEGTYYTSTETMKNLNIYATNASRNELIDYAIKNDNWQPYRWFEAMRTPAYFEYVDGKIEYNKNYWAWLFNGLRTTYILQLDKGLITQGEYDRFVKEYVDKYNNAPGYAVHATHLNHSEEVRKETGAIAFNPDFFESIWNDQKVIQGQFKDGYNPFVELRAALNKQNTN